LTALVASAAGEAITEDGSVRRRKGLAAMAGALAVLALALTGCTAPSTVGGPEPAMRGQWQLLSGMDAAGTIPLDNQIVSLTINDENSTTGRSTCSNYSARIFGTMANLWVKPKLPRAEHCGVQAQQDIEHRYIADLGQVRYSTVTEGVLDLLAPGVDLRYQKALTVPLTLVTDRTWYLWTAAAYSYGATANATPVYFAAPNPTPDPRTEATVSFGANGAVRADTGCRVITADYTQNAGELVVSRFKYRPSGHCTDNDVQADTYLVGVLQGGFTFLSGAGQLVLKSPRAEIEVTLVN
jgi:heat shock protein HslJ